MIWGDTDLLRRITVAVGDDPAIDQLLILYDHPQGLAPEAAASWAAVRAGIVAGADETEAATLVASTLPDLIDDGPAASWPTRGVPAVAGLRTALACARALRLPAAEPGRLREIARPLAGARRRDADADAADGWMDEIDAKELLRTAGLPVPEGRVAASEDDCGARGCGVGWAGGDQAGVPGPAPQDRGGRASPRPANRRGGAGCVSRALGSPAGDGARVLVERMVPPGVELLVAARADAVVPALVVGLGGIWTEALDDVAIVPLPAERGAGRARRLNRCGAPPASSGGRGRDAGRPRERRRARRSGRARCCSSTGFG